jgi:hypothetical protein
MKASATEIQVDLLIVCTTFCTTFPFAFKAARKHSQSRDGLFLRQHLTTTISWKKPPKITLFQAAMRLRPAYIRRINIPSLARLENLVSPVSLP